MPPETAVLAMRPVVQPADESTAGVRLRSWRMTDVDVLVTSCADPDISRYCWPYARPYGAEDALHFLEGQRRAAVRGTAMFFAVEDVRRCRVLGGVSLYDIDVTAGTANIGYWLRSEFRGQGLATAAVRQLIHRATTSPSLRRLDLCCLGSNARSRGVADRCGFRLARVTGTAGATLLQFSREVT